LPVNSRLFLWPGVSALAGFLFGFDTVVISGAEQKIQALWGRSPGTHGLAMNAALGCGTHWGFAALLTTFFPKWSPRLHRAVSFSSTAA
jgi:hypothetical protein